MARLRRRGRPLQHRRLPHAAARRGRPSGPLPQPKHDGTAQRLPRAHGARLDRGADRRKLKPGETFQIGQIVSVKVDVIENGSRENGSDSRCANKEADKPLSPIKSSQAGPAQSPDGCPGAHSQTFKPGSNRPRRGPERGWSRYAHWMIAFANRLSLALRASRPSAGQTVRASATTALRIISRAATWPGRAVTEAKPSRSTRRSHRILIPSTRLVAGHTDRKSTRLNS